MRIILTSAALLSALSILPYAGAFAQSQDRRVVSDSIYLRAQQLVSEGNGTDGRAIIDSLLRALPPGSADYAETLYWKAALASTAADAERAYLRLTIDHPLSARAGAALMRLAQLELARGDRVAARGRLERLVTEHRDGPLWPRAQYWLARSYFEENALAEGCAAVSAARGATDVSDVELRNQLDAFNSRCAGVVVDGADVPAPVNAAVAAAPVTRAGASPPVAQTDSAPAAVAIQPPRVDSTPLAVVVEPLGSDSTLAVPVVAAGRAAFTVQMAAFESPESAERMIAQLATRGITAHLSTGERWHRVRVGEFMTRDEASSRAEELREIGLTGFVTGIGSP